MAFGSLPTCITKKSSRHLPRYTSSQANNRQKGIEFLLKKKRQNEHYLPTEVVLLTEWNLNMQIKNIQGDKGRY